MKNFNLLGSTALAGLALAAGFVVDVSNSKAQAQVSTQFLNAQTGTTYTFLNSDCSKLVTTSNASAVAATLPQASTSGKFFPGCFIDVFNKGAGALTITPTTSTINGGTTLVLTKNQGARLVSDGTNYQVQLGAGIGGGTAYCTSTSGGECSAFRGVVTTSSLSTAANVSATVAFTNTLVGTTSVILCTLGAYSGTANTNGVPVVTQCTPTAGVITATIANVGTTALSGTVAVQFAVLK